MRPPSAAQSRAGAVAPTPRGFPVVACPDSIARDTRCLLLTHTSISAYTAATKNRGRNAPSVYGCDIQARMVLTAILNCLVHGIRDPHVVHQDGLKLDLNE